MLLFLKHTSQYIIQISSRTLGSPKPIYYGFRYWFGCNGAHVDCRNKAYCDDVYL